VKICLIHPNHPNSTDDRLDPPLGLLSIASHLIKQNNYQVKITDLSGYKTPPRSQLIREEIPLEYIIPYADYYGITVYVTSIEITKKIVKICRKINPNCKIIIGGAHSSACPDEFPYVDHVVVGYGEVSLIDIIQGKETDHIVYGKHPDNFFMFPSYDLINPESYSRKIGGNTSLPILTSRGCPYSCNFCGLATMHKYGNRKVEMADPNVIISQLKRIKNDFGITSINFQDDIFTLNRDRLYKILDATKDMGIKFRCMGRAGYDVEEVYERLAESGCMGLAWGVESGSQHMLDRMNKQVKVQDNYNVIQWAKKYGIDSRAFFIIGFPGETKETLEETKQFIIDADPDQIFISSFVPYPCTPVWNNPETFGIKNITKDYKQFYQVSSSGFGGLTIDTAWLSREEFRELEIEFRTWSHTRHMRGTLQDYEKRIEENCK
jgi:radical SAM superfamily enzyme YgiQ (UPF0313 family)